MDRMEVMTDFPVYTMESGHRVGINGDRFRVDYVMLNGERVGFVHCPPGGRPAVHGYMRIDGTEDDDHAGNGYEPMPYCLSGIHPEPMARRVVSAHAGDRPDFDAEYDGRYSINLAWIGHSVRRWTVDFCDKGLGWRETRDDALMLATSHHAHLFGTRKEA